MKLFCTVWLFVTFNLFALNVIATTYYVSPSGSNTNSGTSPIAAWQTITAINLATFASDTILFEGGNTFTGNMTFTSADIGTSTNPIVISSYGAGRATIAIPEVEW